MQNPKKTPPRIAPRTAEARARHVSSARIACLLVPDLPLHAELRASPDLVGTPLVILSGRGPRAEIITTSREALAQGVRVGQTLPQARAVCPELVPRIASPILEKAAREALLDIALSLSPRAELAERASGFFVSEGAVHLDASGIEALHGNERSFASVLHARAERAGLCGYVALASSRGVARLAARHLAHSLAHPLAPSPTEDAPSSPSASSSGREASSPTRILSPRDELAFLAPLPIDLLDPDDATAERLTRFGIHTLHDLLRLPRRDLAARLGPGLLELVARARGEAVEPPLSEPRVHGLEEGIDLEAPIESLEPLAFVFRGLVSRLVERLGLRALGCTELSWTLQLENGRRESQRIGVASPTQDGRVLLRLLRRAAESQPPAAAVDSVALRCEGVPLRREQLDLFLPRGPSPSELDQTLAELSALCGADRVGAPEVVDAHRPGAFALKPFTSKKHRSTPIRDEPEGSRTHPRLTLRAIRPPLRAEVRLAGGRPIFLRSAVSQGDVVTAAGPWRTTGHWWSESAHFAVDHYDVQMSDGNVLRVCFDWKTKWWHVDGLYD